MFKRDPVTGRLNFTPMTGVTVHHGVYPVKKWPCTGWILERWYPNHMWGSREKWESERGEDGITPILGEYPSRGDYWMQCGPWPRLPDLDDIEQAISRFDWEMSNNPVNTELLMESLLKTYAQDEINAEYAYLQEMEAFIKAEISPIWKSTTLEASRIRNAAARAAGQTSHVTL
jgi:hypothetical protein